MRDVEGLLRESLTDRVTAAPASEDLLPRLRLAEARQRRRRRAGVLAAAGLALAAMVAVPLAVAVARSPAGGGLPLVPGGSGSPTGQVAASVSPDGQRSPVPVTMRSGPVRPLTFPYTPTVGLKPFRVTGVELVGGQPQLLLSTPDSSQTVTVTALTGGAAATLPPMAATSAKPAKVGGVRGYYLPALADAPERWGLYWPDPRQGWLLASGTGPVDLTGLLKFAGGLADRALAAPLALQLSAVPAELTLGYADASTMVFFTKDDVAGAVTGADTDAARRTRLGDGLVISLVTPAPRATDAPSGTPASAVPSSVGSGPAVGLPGSDGRVREQVDAAGTLYTVRTEDGATVLVRVPGHLVIGAGDLLRFVLGIRATVPGG